MEVNRVIKYSYIKNIFPYVKPIHIAGNISNFRAYYCHHMSHSLLDMSFFLSPQSPGFIAFKIKATTVLHKFEIHMPVQISHNHLFYLKFLPILICEVNFIILTNTEIWKECPLLQKQEKNV